MVCYISAFHLNVNDWFSEYENIEIFNIQLLSKLGKSSSKFLTYHLSNHLFLNFAPIGVNFVTFLCNLLYNNGVSSKIIFGS